MLRAGNAGGDRTPGEGLSASLAVGPGQTLKRGPSLGEAEAGDLTVSGPSHVREDPEGRGKVAGGSVNR